jgi:GT2 family glycosyltransferase
MQNKIRVSVIIPSWNGRHLLEECLSSLNDQTFKEFEIIVVDNASTDNTNHYLQENYPEVKIVNLDNNYGFARAINRGVEVSDAEFVVLLNNDTQVDKLWLEELLKTADKHPEVISVGSKLLNFYDKTKIDGVGIVVDDVGHGKSIGWNQTDNGQYDKEMYVLGVTGGASLFRRQEFIELGMFDEDFFMYYEEIDFAFRAQYLGYQSIYCPTAVVYHKHKQTSAKKPQHVEYWQFRNMTQMILIDYPLRYMLRDWHWLKIILVHLNTILYQWKHGFWWAPVRADLWIILHLPKILRKRWRVQSSKKVKEDEVTRWIELKKFRWWGISRN